MDKLTPRFNRLAHELAEVWALFGAASLVLFIAMKKTNFRRPLSGILDLTFESSYSPSKFRALVA